MENFALSIVFLNQRHDLDFVFKFRKISKWCKSYSEEWTIEIMDYMYLQNVDVGQFKNLKKVQCGRSTCDSMIQNLKHLEVLDLDWNGDITDVGVKNLKLEKLVGNYLLTNESIKNMTTLKDLTLTGNCPVSDIGLLNLNLYSLNANMGGHISHHGIKHMTSLRKLIMSNNTYISDNSLRNLNLEVLIITNADNKISDVGIQHMTNLRVLHMPGNFTITDAGIKNMQLENLNISVNNFAQKSLDITDPYGITNFGIQNMTSLRELYLHRNSKITDDGIKNLQLKVLDASYSSRITDLTIRSMTSLCKLNIDRNSNVTDEGIRDLQLVNLSVSYNNSITNAGIQNMTTLKVLTITGNNNIHGGGLVRLNLTHLYTMCREVSKEEIAHMDNCFLCNTLGDTSSEDELDEYSDINSNESDENGEDDN